MNKHRLYICVYTVEDEPEPEWFHFVSIDGNIGRFERAQKYHARERWDDPDDWENVTLDECWVDTVTHVGDYRIILDRQANSEEQPM